MRDITSGKYREAWLSRNYSYECYQSPLAVVESKLTLYCQQNL
jgi:hypothetical protein